MDPIRDGDNWYVYVGNDPVNYRDYLGLLTGVDDTVVAAAAVVVVVVAVLTSPPGTDAIERAGDALGDLADSITDFFKGPASKPNTEPILDKLLEEANKSTPSPNPSNEPERDPDIFPIPKPPTPKDDEEVPLYRAVGDAEKELIESTGRFWPSPGGLERKYFSATEEGARQFGMASNESGYEPAYTTVFQTSIPKDMLSPDMFATGDRGVPMVAVPNEKLPVLGPPINKGPLECNL